MKLTTQLKDDWLWRLPERLDNMKFKGANRPAYTLLCLMYYSIKDIIIIVCVLTFRLYKLIFWDIWKWVFNFEQRSWYRKLFYKYIEFDEEDDKYDDEYECPEYEDSVQEDLPFCQLFVIGTDMCLLVDHVEMCPDETAFIRVVDDEGYTPLYKRKVRRDKEGGRFIVFNSTNHYLDDNRTQPIITNKEKDHST